MLGDGYLAVDTHWDLARDFNGLWMTILQRDPAPAPAVSHSQHRQPLPPPRDPQGNKKRGFMLSQLALSCAHSQVPQLTMGNYERLRDSAGRSWIQGDSSCRVPVTCISAWELAV